MKRANIIWIGALVVSSAVLFVVGAQVGRRTALSDVARQSERWEARTSLGNYTVYRDIAVAIANARYARAECTSQLSASAFLDDVRRCAANSACRSAIEAEAMKVAPEALGQAALPFKYFEAKANRRDCG